MHRPYESEGQQNLDKLYIKFVLKCENIGILGLQVDPCQRFLAESFLTGYLAFVSFNNG